MTKAQRDVLMSFADMGVPASKFEVFGHGARADLDDVVMALCGAGLLVALPYCETSDRHGGTRLRVTPEGYAELGITPKQPAPVVKMHGARVMNGRHRKGA